MAIFLSALIGYCSPLSEEYTRLTTLEGCSLNAATYSRAEYELHKNDGTREMREEKLDPKRCDAHFFRDV